MEKYDAAVAVAGAAGQNDDDDEGMLPPPLPPRVVGICVGEGEAMSTLKGVHGVVCVGWKAGEELAKIVASCDIMVAPSEVQRVALRLRDCKPLSRATSPFVVPQTSRALLCGLLWCVHVRRLAVDKSGNT